jgi:4-alpha-glucanotransferase
MAFSRASGILLHPTSLPGDYGVGDLGGWAYRFVEFLASAGQTLWQVLPLGPTSYGDSPYQALSAFAGNPLLISLDGLRMDGWLHDADLADRPDFPAHTVDYGWVIPYHNALLDRAAARFAAEAGAAARAEFEAWCAAQTDWLDDFALFMACKNAHGGAPWVEWEPGIALREPAALDAARGQHAAAIAAEKFRQWAFAKQWNALKAFANARGVQIVGDLPIFVAHDSSDVWANRHLFTLDERGNPTVIAGVPPDYFSETGQRWGNPLYRWDDMAATGYAWWVARLRATLAQVDIVRIDHFRGFEAYWEVPATEETAINGRWVKGPGAPFFTAMRAALGGGDLPIIAEDLGVITPEVEALRDGAGLPGMKVLQFAWGTADGANSFLPHHHVPNAVVYTGTHDNNTSVGWWLDPGEVNDTIRGFFTAYIGHDVHEVNWELIRLAEMSVCDTCVIPMQDLLGLGAEARMNLPGRQGGNWGWRMLAHQFETPARERLAFYTRLYDRVPAAGAERG